ncbi:kinase-like domain-containing protein [Mycena maculata]|uniref:Kinase-like domain-containing protein n=1 Tax=Mycena maculata TaxID=230809 RepID=A0AAD7NZH4_9AGAR|nr:kinase-like domain-containing protein [Mycena maculata]
MATVAKLLMLDTWRKPVSRNEVEVYRAVPFHPRILKFQELSDFEDYLVLQYHPKGDLWSYLIEEKPSLTTRISWALEIAEGITHLHYNSVVWADAHLRNILVTEDLHVVLADFAYSIINPEPLHWFTTRPPPIFTCPIGYYGSPNTHVDIFGCGVMLFALLTTRFPWTADLLPSDAEQELATQKHFIQQFDTIDNDSLRECFGPVVENCFNVVYATGEELFTALKTACDKWATSGALLAFALD